MKAAYYEEFGGPIDIVSLRDPEPVVKGVVIRVEASGLCLSDWHGWKGHDPEIRLPHVPGHELAGTIIAVGKEVRKFKEGQRVTVPFVGGCGQCTYCLEGNQHVCDHQFQPGFTAWGSFAEFVAIDFADENLVILPEYLDTVNAAALGCRFITAYHALKDQGKLSAGQIVAVHGCGGVGLSAIMIAKALGARVIGVDISDQKCSFAKSIGADSTINTSKEDVVETLREISKGGVHLSIDALGSRETCMNSIMGLRKKGKHIQVGLMSEERASALIPMPLIIAHELEILGSHGMQAHKYPEIFHLIEKAGMDLSLLISQRVSLEKAVKLLPQMDVSEDSGITIINSFGWG